MIFSGEARHGNALGLRSTLRENCPSMCFAQARFWRWQTQSIGRGAEAKLRAEVGRKELPPGAPAGRQLGEVPFGVHPDGTV